MSGICRFLSTNETVREAFARIGEVTDVHIVTDRTSGQIAGVRLCDDGDASRGPKSD